MSFFFFQKMRLKAIECSLKGQEIKRNKNN
jgi:hypothetical protein